MKIIYQLLLSVSEIAAALIFLIAARRIAPALRPIIIQTGNPRSEQTEYRTQEILSLSADEIAEQFLITNGIRTRAKGSIKSIACANGLIYMGNILSWDAALQGRRIMVLESCSTKLNRQLLSGSVQSGLILTHMIQGSINQISN